jgi:hypothetical protein
MVIEWGAEVQSLQNWICDTLFSVYSTIKDLDVMKPTPCKPYKEFSWLYLFKICSGMILVEPSYMKDKKNLIKLFYHETLRAICDQVADDVVEQEKLDKAIKKACLVSR